MGILLKKPWRDMRPVLVAGIPEVREYRMRGYNDDQQRMKPLKENNRWPVKNRCLLFPAKNGAIST